MKKLLGQLLRSISGGISPGGIAIPSSFYGWIFFRLSIASSKIKSSRCFSLPKLPSIDVDVQICLGVPKCPHFAPRFCSLLSVSITKKVIDMKNSSYTCGVDIYDKIFVEMLMCIVGNRGDFFFSTSDSTTLFCGVLEIPYLALCTSAFLVARQLLI